MKPIYDSWDLDYKSIFGAVKQNEKVRFTIRLPKNTNPEYPPVVVLFRTGFKERFISMNEIEEEDDCIAYSAWYDAKYSDVHYYYFSYKADGRRYYIKKVNCHEGSLDNGDLFQLTVYKKSYDTPDFLKGGVMYQIFPDRFCKSGKVHENIPDGRVLRDDWNGTPYYKPDSNGHVWNNDYFGGDFAGIQSKLPYLKDLGVTCIYLNPIFESHENHRYNTANYMKADPLLGTNEEFAQLCEEAHKLGIAVILDGVFSHTGADSIYFNKFGRYGNSGAFQSKDSEYYDWYSFINYPNEYEAWWGIDTLPNVIENNEKYTNYICGDGGVLKYWLSLGADGYRLDVADELPDEFLDSVRNAVKQEKSDAYILGEVWEDASNKISYGARRRFLRGRQLDSVMNYPFANAIISFVKNNNAQNLVNVVLDILENYPKQCVNVLMNHIGTHDTKRIITELAKCDDYVGDRQWQSHQSLSREEYETAVKKLQISAVIQYTLPGVPSLFYGDEAGVQGYGDPFCRATYPWGAEDKDLLEFYKNLGKIRRKSHAFKKGGFSPLVADGGVLVFERTDGKDKTLVAVNAGQNAYEYTVPNVYLKAKTVFGTPIKDGKLILNQYGFTIATI